MTDWFLQLSLAYQIFYSIGIFSFAVVVLQMLPKLVEEQAQAISNLKIDKNTVWDSGAGKDGKGSTADFLSGMVRSLPPLHEITKNAGIELPEYLGKLGAKKASLKVNETEDLPKSQKESS